MTLIDQIAAVGAAYCEARGLSVARVSTLVFNDGSKLGDLMSGASDVTTKRYERAIQWFSDNWPEGADWPEGIPRPVPASPQGCAPPVSPADAGEAFSREAAE